MNYRFLLLNWYTVVISIYPLWVLTVPLPQSFAHMSVPLNWKWFIPGRQNRPYSFILNFIFYRLYFPPSGKALHLLHENKTHESLWCYIWSEKAATDKLLKHNNPVAVSRLHFFMSLVGSKLFALKMRPCESGFIQVEAIKIIALENALISHMSHICVSETRSWKGQRV